MWARAKIREDWNLELSRYGRKATRARDRLNHRTTDATLRSNNGKDLAVDLLNVVQVETISDDDGDVRHISACSRIHREQIRS